MQWQPQAVDVSQGVLAAKDQPEGTESSATDKWNKERKKKWIPSASKQATICHYSLIIFGVILLIIFLGSVELLSDYVSQHTMTSKNNLYIKWDSGWRLHFSVCGH